MYFPKAEELTKIAEEAEKAGEKEKASEYYLYVQVFLRLPMNAEHIQSSIGRLSNSSIPNAPIRKTEVCLESWKRGIL